MIGDIHPLAPEHLPRFISPAIGSDPLFTLVLWLLVILLMTFGVLYLKLHALPERMAHRQSSTQLQFIAVLAVLALFTHNNIFWVAALLLSVVRLPDYLTPINSIATSLSQLVATSDVTSSRDAPSSSKPLEEESTNPKGEC